MKPTRVQESIFSIEAKLIEVVDFKASRSSVNPHDCLAIIEATRFWVREDALDEKQGHIDLNVLCPFAQLGGISYGHITQTFELPRIISWRNVMKDAGPQLEYLIGQEEEANSSRLIPKLGGPNRVMEGTDLNFIRQAVCFHVTNHGLPHS